MISDQSDPIVDGIAATEMTSRHLPGLAIAIRDWGRSAIAATLDRAVSELLPAYGFDPRITVRMLLNQTSGLDDYTVSPEAASWTTGVSAQTVLTKITKSALLFSPGTAYSYSRMEWRPHHQHRAP